MGLKMKFKVTVLVVACVVAAIPFLVHGQTINSLVLCIKELNATAYPMTKLDKALMDFNIQHAYDHDAYANIQGYLVKWYPTTAKLETHYYIPPYSALLKTSSKEQIQHLEATLNGLRASLVQAFTGVPLALGGDLGLKLFSEIGEILEVQFLTNEGRQIYTIARFKDGKLQLVREKMNMPK